MSIHKVFKLPLWMQWLEEYSLTAAIVIIVFLVACSPKAVGLSVETPAPAVVSPTSTPASTLVPVTITPSPLPTQPTIPMITPDAIQMERWKEYEDALATALFPPKYIPQSPSEFLCEWEILGRTDQEVYVWTECMSTFSVGGRGLPYHSTMPAVIHIGADGVVQSVEIPGIHYADDIRRMFPPDAQERYFDGLINFQGLTDHLRRRREHPEEPPLIILSATQTP